MTKEKMLLAQIVTQKIEWLTDQIDEFNRVTAQMIKDDRYFIGGGIDYSSELTNAIDQAKNAFTKVIGTEIHRLKQELDSL